MNIFINQPWGLGDIIYCQTLANDWIAEGHKVTWGIFPQFVEQCNRAYPNVAFVDWRSVKIDYDRMDEHDSFGYRVVPLRHNVEIMNVPYSECMRSKYTMFNHDFNRWKEGAMWVRDERKERDLYLLTDAFIHKGKGYNLINETFGSQSQLKANMYVNNGCHNIYMSTIGKYSLFDWALIIENASEIHTVSSSILYILEMLDLKQPIHLYDRKPIEKGFANVDYLFTKPYILHS